MDGFPIHPQATVAYTVLFCQHNCWSPSFLRLYIVVSFGEVKLISYGRASCLGCHQCVCQNISLLNSRIYPESGIVRATDPSCSLQAGHLPQSFMKIFFLSVWQNVNKDGKHQAEPILTSLSRNSGSLVAQSSHYLHRPQ